VTRLHITAAVALVATVSFGAEARAAPQDTPAVEAIIKADVASMIAGINGHDASRATQFDAPDIISMEAGRVSSVGSEADKAGLAMAMKHEPSWRLAVIDETVDVAASGDLAVYRCTANQEFTGDDGTPMTERMNYLAEFRRQADGGWRVSWSMVAPMEKPHKK
jgi:ketosteroid isomerase-like protein